MCIFVIILGEGVVKLCYNFLSAALNNHFWLRFLCVKFQHVDQSQEKMIYYS